MKNLFIIGLMVAHISCLTLNGQVKRTSDEMQKTAVLENQYIKTIGEYMRKSVTGLPKVTQETILIAKAKKFVLSYEHADYFGLQEKPEIALLKITEGQYMPRDKRYSGKMAYRLNFYKTPEKKEFKHIVYIMEDDGDMSMVTNIHHTSYVDE